MSWGKTLRKSDLVLVDSFQNTTIEERVTILEAQMTFVEAAVVDLEDQADFLFDEVASLDDAQVLQDQRILILEEETSGKHFFTKKLTCMDLHPSVAITL